MNLISIFKEKGVLHTLSEKTPFSLKTPHLIFFAQGDPIRLVGLQVDIPLSTNFLFSGYNLSIVSQGNTHLYALNYEELPLEQIADLFMHQWTPNLTHYFSIDFASGRQSGDTHILISSKKSETTQTCQPKETSVFDSQGVWIEVIEGSLLIHNHPKLCLTSQSGPFPCVHPLWLMSDTYTRVRVISHDTLVQQGRLQTGISTFTTMLNRALQIAIEERRELDVIHLKERAQEGQNKFQTALIQGRKLLSPTKHASFTSIKNPLEQALLYIGHQLHVEFIFQPASDRQNYSESRTNAEDIALICEASQIRFRKVILKGNWQQNQPGPLLCFQNDQPVAYLHNEFILQNGQRASKTAVDPVAYLFYLPLPPHAQTGKQICLSLLRSHLSINGSLILFGLSASLIALWPPIATSLLFKYAIPLGNHNLVLYVWTSLIAAAIGFASFSWLRNSCFLRLEGLVSHFMQTALWDRLLKLTPSFFHKFSAGALYWKIASIDTMRQLVRDSAAYTILNGLFAFVYLWIMLIYSPLLTLVTGFVALLGFSMTLVLSYFKVRFLHQEVQLQQTIQGDLIQLIGGVGKLRTTGSEKQAFAHWSSLFIKAKFLTIKAQQIQNIISTASTSLPILSMWALYSTLVLSIGVKNLILPDFLAFITAFASFSLAIYPLNETIGALCKLIPLWKQTQDIRTQVPEESTLKINPGTLSGAIHVDNVSFQYPDATKEALTSISLTIRPGECIGIVGASGSGKSTLLRLLLGFETPSSGVIYYDDKDLSTLNPQSIRKQIGSVLQTSDILPGTIYQNLVCGGSYTKENIQSAIELSGFAQDLPSLPMGLHTYLAAGGNTISGGQKQRLLLARALVGSPSLLIFDEATSALDNQTQRHVTEHIESLNVTRIIVAQRLSTIRHTDRIYVLDQGQIVQSGSFDELSQVPGIFFDMFKRQRLI